MATDVRSLHVVAVQIACVHRTFRKDEVFGRFYGFIMLVLRVDDLGWTIAYRRVVLLVLVHVLLGHHVLVVVEGVVRLVVRQYGRATNWASLLRSLLAMVQLLLPHT